MVSTRKLTACLSGSIAALLSAGGASAQTGAAASGLELEEVVVTAERVAKDLQKVSQVINVTTGEQLKKEGKTRIDEMLRGIAGIELQSDQVDTNIYMRGVSTGVPMIIDGVSQGTGGTTVRGTTLDVAQVEISRGVQNGAGTTSLTGAVNVVTNKPVFEYQASGALTVGSYNLRNTEGVVNLPLSDNQAIRVAYSSDRRDGYYPNDAGNSDNRLFRLRYRWQPSDNLDINASFSENRTEGNGVSQSVLLYTGHWVDLTAGQNIAWTNPYTGTTSVWGQNQAAANRIYLSGNVNAANNNTIAANQFSYPAGPCSQSANAFSTGIVSAMGATPASFTPGNVGPFITTLGCPMQHLAIRDGVYFFDRSNPWDDGSKKYNWWSNSPVRNSLSRQANIDINWKLPVGTLTIQPAYVYSLNNFVEPARGTSWMVQGGIPSKSARLDVQLAANNDSRIQWVGGFNSNYTFKPDRGASFTTIAMPTSGWTTSTAGMSATAGINTNCYTVLPTGATTQGIANSAQCYSSNYSAGGASYNYGVSLQGSIPFLDDKLRVNGSVRHDRYASESQGAAITTLVDGDGQRYVWYVPATTYATPTVADPNGLFQVPYRMNLSQADMDAMVNSTHSWRKSNTTSFTMDLQYDVLDNTMVYTKFATGATGAMAAGMGGATGGNINVTLPNAVVPAGTLAGTNYVTQIALPAPSVKGETTQQISLGEKSRWFDNKLQVNVEAFYNKYKNRGLNLILGSLYGYVDASTTLSTASACTASATVPIRVTLGDTSATSCFAANVGSYTGNMLSKGVDMEVSWLPTNKDRLDWNVEYLRTTFNGIPQTGTLTAADVTALATAQGSNAASTSTYAQTFADGWNSFLGNIDGKTLPKAPRWSSTLNYQHEFDLPNGSRITPRLTAYYKSAFYFTENLQSGDTSAITDSNWAIDNGKWLPSVQKSYSLFDFYTTWSAKDGKWFISGYVKNIENEPVLSSTGGLTTWSTGSIATNDLSKTVLGGYANLEAPRTFGLTLTANF